MIKIIQKGYLNSTYYSEERRNREMHNLITVIADGSVSIVCERLCDSLPDRDGKIEKHKGDLCLMDFKEVRIVRDQSSTDLDEVLQRLDYFSNIVNLLKNEENGKIID